MCLRDLILITCALAFSLNLHAQGNAPDNWFNLDKEQDGVHGVSTERTYKELLSNRVGQQVIVAVIDGGVDPHHEDLKDVMWRNPGEVPDNGKDDDGNGYVDDVFGWNFIGGKDGENVHHDTYELTRILKGMEQEFQKKDPKALSGKEKEKYHTYQKYKTDVESARNKANEQVQQFEQILTYIKFTFNMAKEALGDKQITEESVEELDDNEFAMVKAFLKEVLPQLGDFEGGVDDLFELITADLDEALQHEKNKVDYGYNTEFNPRHIVQDDYSNVSQRFYGNNDVKGPDAFHGTHVAGIIAASRQNEIGIKGVADQVKIMAIRAVPNGDERDKDVANAIRYAVDNGASIINMSFGKGYSPREKAVERAIRYAQKKDVLLVHAAGNESSDNDVVLHYPDDQLTVHRCLFCGKVAKNWLEVGALSYEDAPDAVAFFSNYGKKNVDVFAPGHEINSTDVDSRYKVASGTSFAAPVVAGVAAVMRSYFPKLTAIQVKSIIMRSSVKEDVEVKVPGSDQLVKFEDLSVSGGMVNLYRAIKIAATESGKSNEKSASTRKSRA